MALSDERLREIERKFNAERVRTSDEEYLVIYPSDYYEWQRAIEAEVHKGCEPLIRQMLDALTDIVEAGEEAWGKDRPCVRIGKEAITAARARLGEKT